MILLTNGFIANADAAEVTLAWDPPDIDVAGYNLYYVQCQAGQQCTTIGKDKSSLEVYHIEIADLEDEDAPQITIYNLSDIHQYAFAVTAYNESGEESEFSNEVIFTPSSFTSSDTQDSNDSDSSSQTDTSQSSDNQPPEVDAGKDQSLDIKLEKAIISGKVVDDGLPENKITYKWYQKSGPGTAEFDDASKLTTSVKFDQTGTYILVLKADDGQLTASDSITITVYEETSDGSANSNNGQSTDGKQTIIIDNDDTENTTLEGSWFFSNTLKCYGDNSIYGKRGATFSYYFSAPTTGFYDLTMWWTRHQNRSSAVPISIESEKGIEKITVNQQTNGEEWYSLGIYKFKAGETYEIMITAMNIFRTTSVDALKFTYEGENEESLPQQESDGESTDNEDDNATDSNNFFPGCGSNITNYQ